MYISYLLPCLMFINYSGIDARHSSHSAHHSSSNNNNNNNDNNNNNYYQNTEIRIIGTSQIVTYDIFDKYISSLSDDEDYTINITHYYHYIYGDNDDKYYHKCLFLTQKSNINETIINVEHISEITVKYNVDDMDNFKNKNQLLYYCIQYPYDIYYEGNKNNLMIFVIVFFGILICFVECCNEPMHDRLY